MFFAGCNKSNDEEKEGMGCFASSNCYAISVFH
jgi:hypothetical protein